MSRKNRARREDPRRARHLERQARRLRGLCLGTQALRDLCGEVRRRGRCLLCGGPSSDVHVWMPGPELAGRFLVPTGQSRAIQFCACGACMDGPGATGRVGEAIVAAWGRMVHGAGAHTG